MKLKHIYTGNLILLVLLAVTVIAGLASGSANGLMLPFVCALPLFLFVTGGSVFTTLYTMKDKKLIDATEYERLKKTKDRSAANVPLG